MSGSRGIIQIGCTEQQPRLPAKTWRISFIWAVFRQDVTDNQGKNKRVESLLGRCLDPGSTPGISTTMTETVYDPLRKKLVASTPEERVRQWFIGELSGPFGVPLHRMASEVSLSVGNKKYRADILVYGAQSVPLAVVECKRPDVELTSAVLEQALRYNVALGVRYLVVTNGKKTYIYENMEGTFRSCGSVPDFKE